MNRQTIQDLITALRQELQAGAEGDAGASLSMLAQLERVVLPPPEGTLLERLQRATKRTWDSFFAIMKEEFPEADPQAKVRPSVSGDFIIAQNALARHWARTNVPGFRRFELTETVKALQKLARQQPASADPRWKRLQVLDLERITGPVLATALKDIAAWKKEQGAFVGSEEAWYMLEKALEDTDE